MRERILYLPIIAPGTYHDVALANKRGLRTAFEKIADVCQWDYVASRKEMFVTHFKAAIEEFQPTLIFTQFQGSDWIAPSDLRAIRQDFGVPIVNWCGDGWEHELTTPDMLALLHEVDLQLVIVANALRVYEHEGIRAAFWPFGVEEPNRPLPDMPSYDVVFLANNYTPERQAIYEVLRSLPYKVGIYGSGWTQAEGECNYDFAYGRALYQNAKICISDNQFPDNEGYLSDRPYQAMAAGCLVLQQHVNDLEQWTGFIDGMHYIGWHDTHDYAELKWQIQMSCAGTSSNSIARSGQAFVLSHHTWDNRVSELMTLLAGVTHAH